MDLIAKAAAISLVAAIILGGCTLSTQETVVVQNSPHESRVLVLLNEIWEPCFRVYIIRQSPEIQFAGILGGRYVLVNEAFANSLASRASSDGKDDRRPGADNILRAILAHEVAHAILKHDEKRSPARKDLYEEMFQFLSGIERTVKTGDVRFTTNAYVKFVNKLRGFVGLVYALEIEADETALEILRRKGFDPHDYISALQSLPADFVETIKKEHDGYVQMIRQTTEALRAKVRELPPIDALPPYPTIKDRIAVVQQKLEGAASTAEQVKVASVGCPQTLTDEELYAQIEREKKSEEELEAKISQINASIDGPHKRR